MDIYRIYFLKGFSYEFCENDNIKIDHNEMDVYMIYFWRISQIGFMNMIILKWVIKKWICIEFLSWKQPSDGLCEHGNEISIYVKGGNVFNRWATVSFSTKVCFIELITEPLS